jgi:hypothetical protein
LQVVSGRHCYESFVYNEATKYIIDLTGVRQYGVDSTNGYYIDVGYGNWDMYRMFNNVFGLTLPAGSCYSVGLGGHITGGGYGILSRQFGLTVDYLSAVDIVLYNNGNPTLVTCSSSSMSDLFWAVRGGGGGNFGIITRYYFKSPPKAPSYIYTTAITIDWYDASGNLVITRDVFAEMLDFISQAAKSDQSNKAQWPSFFIFHANHVSAGSMVLAEYAFDVPGTEMCGEDYRAHVIDTVRERHRRLAEIVPISKKPGPIFGQPWHGDSSSLMPVAESNVIRHYTFLEGVQNANGSGPNRFGKYKSAYMKSGFTDTMVNGLYAGLTQTSDVYNMSQCLCQIDSYGCQINTVASNATAVPQRSSILKLQYQAYWDNDEPVGQDDPTQEAFFVDWINNMYSATYADYGGYPNPWVSSHAASCVDGCYYNYPDIYLGTNNNSVPNDPGIDFAMRLYFTTNFQLSTPYNLQGVKNTYNNRNWFASAQSIPLVGSGC